MKSLKALFTLEIPIGEAFNAIISVRTSSAVVREFKITDPPQMSDTLSIESGVAKTILVENQERIVFTYRHPEHVDELIGTVHFREGWMEFRIHNFADTIDLRPIAARLRRFMKYLLPFSCKYYEEGAVRLSEKERDSQDYGELGFDNGEMETSISFAVAPQKTDKLVIQEKIPILKEPSPSPDSLSPTGKRPRGRPRKPVPENPPPKRPRGRPRKSS